VASPFERGADVGEHCHPSVRDGAVPSVAGPTVPAMSRRVPRCPHCAGTPTGVPVLFGLPDPSAVEAAERGEVVLGGCLMPETAPPRWACPQCGSALGWGEPHPLSAQPSVPPAAQGRLRVGVWNLERSPHPGSTKGDEVGLWQEHLSADIWLLTEVHEAWGWGPPLWSGGGSWAVSSPRGADLDGWRRWSGIQTRFRIDELDSSTEPWAAEESLCLARIHLPDGFAVPTVLAACSVLPWRGAAKYWPGLPGKYLDDHQQFVLEHHVARIAQAWDREEPIVWGGDFNQELVDLSPQRKKAGYRLAGTKAGIGRLAAAFERFGLRAVTERSEHLLLGAPTIDHLAVSAPLIAGAARVHRPHYADGRLLSDHAAYLAELDLQPAALTVH
jgi:hypothetical protein